MSSDSFIEQLLGAVPELGPLVTDHRAFYDEELPHVLFGDVVRFTLEARSRGEDEIVGRVLSFVDAALEDGDESVQNVIAVSFVENVGPWDPAMTDFIDSWPPGLRNEAHRQARGSAERPARESARSHIFEHAPGEWWAECLVCRGWVAKTTSRRAAEERVGRTCRTIHTAASRYGKRSALR